MAAFLPDGSILLAQQDGGLTVWDAMLGRPLRAFEPWRDRRAASVAASLDGRHALVRFWHEADLVLYDVPSGRPLRALPFSAIAGHRAFRIAFSPDGSLVAACAWDGREGALKVWDVSTGLERADAGGPDVFDVAFSPDGRTLACTGLRSLRLLDVRTGVVKQIGDWTTGMLGVEFLRPRGSGSGIVVLAEEAPSLSFYEAGGGLIRKMSNLGGGYVYEVAVSPDAAQLLLARAGELLDLSLPAKLRQLWPRVGLAREALQRDPKDGAALRTLGSWYAIRRQWGPAAEVLAAARDAGADVSPLELGRCYWSEGDAERARAEFARAVALAKAKGDDAEMRYLELCLVAIRRNEPTDPFPVPGRIEAEAHDSGGEGVGYHDSTDVDTGTYWPKYRSGAVDVDRCADDGEGAHVGGVTLGEWLAYTVEVKEDGLYDLDLRVSSAGPGGTLHVEFNGRDVTGPISVPDTGSFQQWRTVTLRAVRLRAGKQVMRVVFDAPAADGEHVCNLNWIQIRPPGAAPSAGPPAPARP